MTEHANKSPWGLHTLQGDEVIDWSLSELRLWCKSVGKEILIATQRSSEAESGLPSDSAWSRWALTKKQPHQVSIYPIHPDRMIVVRPEMPFRIISGAKARIYIRVPVWANVALAGDHPVSLLQIPTANLSSAWVGSLESGELAYWLSSHARRKIEPDLASPGVVVCPVEISNKASSELLVERISLRVQNLSIYEWNSQLWSDETRVTYTGSQDLTQIEATGVAPQEVQGATLIAPPRNPIKKGLSSTFATLKYLPVFGFFNSI